MILTTGQELCAYCGYLIPEHNQACVMQEIADLRRQLQEQSDNLKRNAAAWAKEHGEWQAQLAEARQARERAENERDSLLAYKETRTLISKYALMKIERDRANDLLRLAQGALKCQWVIPVDDCHCANCDLRAAITAHLKS